MLVHNVNFVTKKVELDTTIDEILSFSTASPGEAGAGVTFRVASNRNVRNHLRHCIDNMRYKLYLAEPDFWMTISRFDHGTDYIEYALLYVDDSLVVSRYPKEAWMRLGKYIPLKPELVGQPKFYLDRKLSQLELPIHVTAWTISASKYIKCI